MGKGAKGIAHLLSPLLVQSPATYMLVLLLSTVHFALHFAILPSLMLVAAIQQQRLLLPQPGK